jgi:hypothetical protein
LRWDTEPKLTDETTRAIIVALTDWWRRGDTSASDAGLEWTTFGVITTAIRHLTDVVDTDGAWDKAVIIITAEQARNTSASGAALLGATVVIALARGRYTYPLITALIRLTVVIGEAVWAREADVGVELTELILCAIRVTQTPVDVST